jgi:transcriptional regulator with XRE-family HTH domain
MEKKKIEPRELRRIRTRMDLGRSELAEILGIAPPTVAAWENGKNPCSGPAAKLIRLIPKLMENIRRSMSARSLHRLGFDVVFRFREEGQITEEDLADIEAAKEAMKEPGRVSLDEIKAELEEEK